LLLEQRRVPGALVGAQRLLNDALLGLVTGLLVLQCRQVGLHRFDFSLEGGDFLAKGVFAAVKLVDLGG